MAEEFQGGVCGGNWWLNSSRNLFGPISPCNSSAVNDFGWLNRSISHHDSAGTVTDGSISTAQKPTPNDWNIQDLLNDSGRILSEQNYSHHILQESEGLNSSMNNYLPELNSSNNSFTNSASFPLNSASDNLLQNLFDSDFQPQQSVLNNHATNNYQRNSPELLPKQQPAAANHDLQFTNNTVVPFWNNSSAPTSFLSSIQAQFIPPSPKTANVHNFSTKHKKEEAGFLNGAAKKASDEPAFKRQRIETPSPLPTFKVRKEKLGDRVTALQQLVSPFGKTDTASVLHEAIEYIKFLHDQVLSSPYLKNGPNPLQHQQVGNNIKHQEGPLQDLRSRGLCLVPISSTFPVATETTSDFWTPTFGGGFRKADRKKILQKLKRKSHIVVLCKYSRKARQKRKRELEERRSDAPRKHILGHGYDGRVWFRNRNRC